MKKVYIIARNHMDPSWLRCFTDHARRPDSGDVIRPYSDVEETQILEYMDFAEEYGVKYQIEQSLVVKKFLERNPEQKERFRELVKKGLLELAGGGEAVIDYNLTQGESWVRNHLYSREYYKKEFSHSPKYAICPDIFGLPSQLPQFFRSIGYDALIIFDRVMKNNKPFWRGLDGTFIVLDSCFLQPPEPNLRTADCVKLPACRACGGEGCELCEGTGFDVSYDMTRPDKPLLQSAYYGNMSADVFLEELLKTDKEEYFVMITTEEPRIGGFLYGPLKDAAKRHGMEIHYLGFEENHEKWCPGQENRLRAGDFTDDEKELRREGNPVSCGCYTSRVEIKKANRELENLLIEAEGLASLARLNGGYDKKGTPRRDYPSEKIEKLWNKMAFIQFHDCVTGTHIDPAYDELMRYVREVRRGALQIYDDASKELLRSKGVSAPEGFYTAVFFNPTALSCDFPVLSLHAPEGTKSFEVFDMNADPLPAFDAKIYPALVGVGAKVRVKAQVPPFSCRAFLWKPCEKAEEKQCVPAGNGVVAIENERFRITADNEKIIGIFDKKACKKAFGEGSGCLAIGKDVGNPWGWSEPETDHRMLTANSVKAEKTENGSSIVLSGEEFDRENGEKILKWTQSVTLLNGEETVRFHTDLDWNGRDSRIFASFKPDFDFPDRLICEVPFGTMEREAPEPVECLGILDEWPSLGFAGASNGQYSVCVLKGGLPASRLYEGKIQISLLRAFSTNDPNYAETNDRGLHSSDYAIAAWEGDFSDGGASSLAAQFNFTGHTLEIKAPGKWLPEDKAEASELPETAKLLCALPELPANLRLSALKWAEDGSGAIVRFWESAGKETELKMPKGTALLPLTSLEQPKSAIAASKYSFRPFETATFKLIF